MTKTDGALCQTIILNKHIFLLECFGVEYRANIQFAGKFIRILQFNAGSAMFEINFFFAN